MVTLREDKIERAGNQIESQLGNLLNGEEAINGIKPTDMKNMMDMMSDMSQQSQAAMGQDSEHSEDATMLAQQPASATAQSQPVSAGGVQSQVPASGVNPQLTNALQGQPSNLDLSKVPQDQKDFLLQNLVLANKK